MGSKNRKTRRDRREKGGTESQQAKPKDEKVPQGSGEGCDPGDDVYESYLDTRKAYTNAKLEVAKQNDTVLVTLAGSALALSLTFVKDVVPLKSADAI